jgi:SAM-dependent methyltransferase
MSEDAAARDIGDVFRIILGRDPTSAEAAAEAVALADGGVSRVADILLASTEFRNHYFALVGDTAQDEPYRRRHGHALQALESDERVVDFLYTCWLGRPADAEGRQHYLSALANGDTRLNALTWIAKSIEFAIRFVQVAPFVPQDVQLCELANPAKWDNPEWLSLLCELQTIPADKLRMHRKGYEWTQLLFGLTRLERIRDDAAVISVGAGHECVLYWLANHVGRVVATDLYDDQWRESRAREGDASVLQNGAAYTPFPYREDRLTFLRMDGRRLTFPDDTFDVAYSLSSIEHFGGFAGAAAALDEMVRVVKPGGIVAVATEYRLSGPAREEVFEPEEVRALFSRPRVRLVEPLDEDVYRRYRYMPVDLIRAPYQTPHLVVKIDDTIFTSVIGFLEKH